MLRLRTSKTYIGPNPISSESVFHCVFELIDGSQPQLAPTLTEKQLERCARLQTMHSASLGRIELGAGSHICDAVRTLTRHMLNSYAEEAARGVRHGRSIGQWEAVFPHMRGSIVERCIEAGLFVVEAAFSSAPIEAFIERLEAKMATLQRTVARYRPSGDALELKRACAKRGIPWRRCRTLPRYHMLGEGRFQKRINLTITPGTSRIPTEIARDKHVANRMLRMFGLPVPPQAVADNIDSARAAAMEIGYPVVTKPRRGMKGYGVTAGVMNGGELEVAFARAMHVESEVLIEAFLAGNDYRLLVANDSVIAISMRVAASVVGDGRHTIQELVRRLNNELRRAGASSRSSRPIEIDEDSMLMLGRAGVSLASVPTKGETVPLKSAKNWSAGGTTVDVTSIAHPDNLEMAVRAVKLIGLDFGGVDFISPDITKSFREVGGGICEVNYKPGILNHIHAAGSVGRDLAGIVVDHVVPKGTRSRMATILVCGEDRVNQRAVVLARFLQSEFGWRVGHSDGSGVFADGFQLSKQPIPNSEAFAYLVEDATLDAAIYVSPIATLLNDGLELERLDVAVLDLGPNATMWAKNLPLIREMLSEAGARLVEARTDAELTARHVMAALNEIYDNGNLSGA